MISNEAAVLILSARDEEGPVMCTRECPRDAGKGLQISAFRSGEHGDKYEDKYDDNRVRLAKVRCYSTTDNVRNESKPTKTNRRPGPYIKRRGVVLSNSARVSPPSRVNHKRAVAPRPRDPKNHLEHAQLPYGSVCKRFVSRTIKTKG
ncbi:hypothetical protein EVAR_83380_1 [Eumeta japonica]|uniref:Uncharacterized protein n=1 Tax=Eumeta variegata TaxID=151549 RepID=A0A4C1TYR3_EUMVA|nr:hypothetical protein EVAR_83380_1 [Eumeta japonica]